MKVKLSVSELQSLSAVMVIAAEAIKQDAIPSREGEDEPIMTHREAMDHMIKATRALWQQYADVNYLQAAIHHSTNRFLIPFENYTGISLIDYTKFRNDLIKIQKMH